MKPTNQVRKTGKIVKQAFDAAENRIDKERHCEYQHSKRQLACLACGWKRPDETVKKLIDEWNRTRQNGRINRLYVVAPIEHSETLKDLSRFIYSKAFEAGQKASIPLYQIGTVIRKETADRIFQSLRKKLRKIRTRTADLSVITALLMSEGRKWQGEEKVRK